MKTYGASYSLHLVVPSIAKSTRDPFGAETDQETEPDKVCPDCGVMIETWRFRDAPADPAVRTRKSTTGATFAREALTRRPAAAANVGFMEVPIGPPPRGRTSLV
jgi:hypothetical protein